MATDHQARQPLSDAEHRGQLRRALIASTIGTTIEWYDFLLYSTVTGLVFAKLFFPDSDPSDRDVEGLRYFLYRLCRPPGRRSDLRSLRRPDRPQGGVDRHPGDNRRGDRRGRPGADLRPDRHLGGNHHDRPAVHPGCRGRWRMERFGPDVDGVGPNQRQSRLHSLLAAIWRSGRPCPGQSRRVGVQLDLRRPVPGLGLAHPVPPQHRYGRRSESTSGSAFSKRRCSRSWWRRSASRPHRCWRC